MRSLLARRWIDAVVVALAVLAQAEVWSDPAQTPRWLSAPAALLWTLPLLARRRFPLGAPAAVFAVLAVESAMPGRVVTNSQVNGLALIAAFAIAGGHRDARRALIGATIGFITLAVIVLTEVPSSEGAVPVFLFGGASWAVGRALAERNRRAEALEEHTARLERENANAVLAERARIAREIHDVVAHSVSVMTVQAGAARMLLEEDPARAREPLLAVEESGRQALAEMRRLLGVLRGGDDAAALAPQPGMAQMEALIRQVRSAGLPVDLTAEGEERPLPPGVDLTAYRVVQEALTNVLRHAGAARAQVHVRYGPQVLELEVTDDGHVVPKNNHGGHGIFGMRQRVALYGGELEAGPRAAGGYAVRARLPVDGSDG